MACRSFWRSSGVSLPAAGGCRLAGGPAVPCPACAGSSGSRASTGPLVQASARHRAVAGARRAGRKKVTMLGSGTRSDRLYPIDEASVVSRCFRRAGPVPEPAGFHVSHTGWGGGPAARFAPSRGLTIERFFVPRCSEASCEGDFPGTGRALRSRARPDLRTGRALRALARPDNRSVLGSALLRGRGRGETSWVGKTGMGW